MKIRYSLAKIREYLVANGWELHSSERLFSIYKCRVELIEIAVPNNCEDNGFDYYIESIFIPSLCISRQKTTMYFVNKMIYANRLQKISTKLENRNTPCDNGTC